MAQAPFQNADGLSVKYPNYYKDAGNFVNRFRYVKTSGNVKQAEAFLDLARAPAGTQYPNDLNNDGTNDGFDTGAFYLPAYASVLRVTLLVTEAAVGGTSITIGTYALTGAAISATSLVTATEGVIANFDTLGARTYGNGALVATTAETASVGAADAYVTFVTAGTFTAGKIKVIIDYIDPLGDT